jgi:hypothetical protein
MATNRKTTKETTYSSKDTGNFPKAYMRLRTVLDALEINALQYCLEDKRARARKFRAEEIETWVMPVIQMIQRKMSGDDAEIAGGCQDGYHNCGGVCVPYHCPMSS